MQEGLGFFKAQEDGGDHLLDCRQSLEVHRRPWKQNRLQQLRVSMAKNKADEIVLKGQCSSTSANGGSQGSAGDQSIVCVDARLMWECELTLV